MIRFFGIGMYFEIYPWCWVIGRILDAVTRILFLSLRADLDLSAADLVLSCVRYLLPTDISVRGGLRWSLPSLFLIRGGIYLSFGRCFRYAARVPVGIFTPVSVAGKSLRNYD